MRPLVPAPFTRCPEPHCTDRQRPNRHRAGNYAFHSNHIVTGSTGSHGTDHSAVEVQHETGSFSDPDPITGIMTPDPRSQNGWDAVVTKISVEGVFEGIFAVDTMPVDGKYNDSSLNSGWGGYSYFTVSRRPHTPSSHQIDSARDPIYSDW